MKCLSLWQPWGSLLVSGAKKCETRGWAIKHRGGLLIHAAKTWNADLAYTCGTSPFRAALEAAGVKFEATEAACKRGWNIPFGAIVGRVDVVACYPTDTVVLGDDVRADAYHAGRLVITPTEEKFGDFSPGRFAFLCANPVNFATPIPYRGAQGLFDVPDAVVEKALAAA